MYMYISKRLVFILTTVQEAFFALLTHEHILMKRVGIVKYHIKTSQ